MSKNNKVNSQKSEQQAANITPTSEGKTADLTAIYNLSCKLSRRSFVIIVIILLNLVLLLTSLAPVHKELFGKLYKQNQASEISSEPINNDNSLVFLRLEQKLANMEAASSVFESHINDVKKTQNEINSRIEAIVPLQVQQQTITKKDSQIIGQETSSSDITTVEEGKNSVALKKIIEKLKNQKEELLKIIRSIDNIELKLLQDIEAITSKLSEISSAENTEENIKLTPPENPDSNVLESLLDNFITINKIDDASKSLSQTANAKLYTLKDILTVIYKLKNSLYEGDFIQAGGNIADIKALSQKANYDLNANLEFISKDLNEYVAIYSDLTELIEKNYNAPDSKF